MVFAANNLKCLCIQGNGAQKPIDVRFQEGLLRKYRTFSAKMGPIEVHESDGSLVSTAVRRYLDLRCAYITIDGTVVPPRFLPSKYVGDVPSRQTNHRVCFQVRRNGAWSSWWIKR